MIIRKQSLLLSLLFLIFLVSCTTRTHLQEGIINKIDYNFPSVVLIQGESTNSKLAGTTSEYLTTSEGKLYSKGSGFLVSKDGKIITANHVIEPITGDINVILRSGKEYKAKRISNNKATDIAVIKISGNNFPFLELLNPKNIDVGNDVVFIGYPLKLYFPLVSNSIVSAKELIPLNKRVSINMVVINEFVNPGNSGGPVIHVESGKAIGVVNARMKIDTSEIQRRKIIFPEGYTSNVLIKGVDPLRLSVDTYNMNLEYIGEVTQFGIGFCTSIEYAIPLLK